MNAFGSAVDPATGELYAARHGLAGELAAAAAAGRRRRGRGPGGGGRPADAGKPALATTIGVIATDATLTKAQCQKVAGIGHDGLARAINPVHTMFDGDTMFTLATGAPGARPRRLSTPC